MNRDQTIKKAANVLPYHWRTDAPGGTCSCGHQTPLGRSCSEHVARVIPDAILPQVSTVEELEALPVGAVVVAPSGAAYELRPPGTWYGLNGWQMNARHLLPGRSPLTVVWQP